MTDRMNEGEYADIDAVLTEMRRVCESSTHAVYRLIEQRPASFSDDAHELASTTRSAEWMQTIAEKLRYTCEGLSAAVARATEKCEYLKNKKVYFELKAAGELQTGEWTAVGHGRLLFSAKSEQEALVSLYESSAVNCYFTQVGKEYEIAEITDVE